MLVLFSTVFKKQYKKLPHPIQKKFNERFGLFISNPFHPLLGNHPLKGDYASCQSINITGNYRAIFYEERTGFVRFISIGTHSGLYRK
ncbi:hypothetical protein A2852_02320 [Candidatus Adlerbacteria bacterium RIFCSPHIGHO2_01_FULL_54_23]|uniref:Plasmid stabilization protein n=3 Tax=Candidatus Adleribacteriota TaxID=1752736 RepID=A0A1F4Y108_9BACT|nr:MAG: hypothetical protein UY83_C0002G0063 [Candidatus Adlerbacteria bacterium GW2011_GWA1_54_10]KKW37953.1 MAG: hypothetical protein UY86_C0002G0050 [Candidatus Adlerbacteria bacterium GW2011_GWB1_54_7]OGC78561.1 MAG: hypothetical protein A2852_02320 [Candidatus Adlerbacteria bacterium RIFCSPHIGHO2_01_FULL_54_23]OGC87571.1 MAG: hypothetical protein A3B33_01515 [Candidatus Adlerbacteria bacterium RIFCSPLOWO2_01_FULL_54_16]